MRRTTDFKGFIGAGEAGAAPYRYFPFEVPEGCERVEASYQWFAAEGQATVDLGVFDTRGTEPFTGGFRGWSGSARRSFFLEHERATPGYLAGPLPAGTWSLLLGFYEVPESGVYWGATVSTDTSTRPSSKEGTRSEREEPAADDLPQGGDVLRWYRGDLHTHTEHSDGENSIGEMAAEARRAGLDFLAITDHNTTSHFAEIDAGRWPVLLIGGEEVTMYRGHCNVWGLREWADFRFVSDEEVQRLLRWADERSLPISMNHPKHVGPPWLFADPGFAIREVWQAPWRWYNWESVREWDEALVSGSRIVPVGGSDAHGIPPTARHPHGPGTPTTWVRVARLSEAGIVDAVKAGRTAISDGPDGPFVTLDETEDGGFEVSFARAEGCTLVLVADGDACWRTEVERASGPLRVPDEVRFERYLRAELRAPAPKAREDVRALSAPVYRK